MPDERDRRSISPSNVSIDSACLPIGCSVSAKYRGAFCSAEVKSLVKQVKVKVTLIESGETLTISDEDILQSNSLRLGQTVTIRLNPDNSSVIKTPTKKQAVIKKIIDNSIYTVVFNDGDETTLRRASLCLQGIRLYQNHIGQSKTISHLRSNSPINEMNDKSSVVCIRRQMKEVSQVFPALVLKRKALPDYLWVKSFLDGKEYVVHRRDDVQPYRNNPSMQQLCRLTSKQATQACERFLRHHQIPNNWQKKKTSLSSADDDDDPISEPSDSEEETTEEKDSFLAKLLAFMDERGTPINTIPRLYNYDLDLHRLFKLVRQCGGSNKVTKTNQWSEIYTKMGLPDVSPVEGARTIEQIYKKYLHPFEDLTKKLGNFHSPTSHATGEVRRSLVNRRSQPESSRRKSRLHSFSIDSSEKKTLPLLSTKSRKRIHSKSTDSVRSNLTLKIAKISTDELTYLGADLSSSIVDDDDQRSIDPTDSEMPSIFQSLLQSTDSSTLNFDDIAIDDLLILRDHSSSVRCLEKDAEKSLLFISFLDSSGKDDQWIGFDRVLKRLEREDNLHLTPSTSSSSSSETTTTAAKLISTQKRRSTRDTPTSKDSNKFKFRSPTESTSNDDISPIDRDVPKRQRTMTKRHGRRSISLDNKNSDRYLPINLQLRQRLEEMFPNRTSRYNFLDLNQSVIGEHRLESLKDRLRQCQKVFFNLQMALMKIERGRERFLLREENPCETASPLAQ